jgi:Protein of unknown function (DUF1573)
MFAAAPTSQRRCLLFGLLTAGSLLGCAHYPQAPRLLPAATALDLGQAVPGGTLTGAVTIANAGAQPLHIHKVEAGCGCAAAELTRAVIPPGEHAVLQVRVPIRSEGENLQFTLKLFSNDPMAPTTEVTVRASATPPLLRTHPDVVEFGELCPGTAAVQQVTLLTPQGLPWPPAEPLHVESARGAVQATFTRSGDTAAERVGLEVRPRPDLPLGEFADTLLLGPAGSARRIALPVRGRLVPLFTLAPNTLVFSEPNSASAPAHRLVNVRRTDGQAVPPIARSCIPAGIEIAEGEAGGAQVASVRRLRVTLDPAKVAPDLTDATIQIWLQGETESLTLHLLVIRASQDAGH